MDYRGDEEATRLRALCELDILDTPGEARYDRLTRLASSALRVPVALVALIDEERQWFKSRVGLDTSETPRDIAFCHYTITQPGQMVVTDALLDPRFCSNPLVTGEPHIRFYAGHPIRTLDGHTVGTLCVIDTVPRTFGDADRALLADLAALVETEINRGAAEQARRIAEHRLQQLHGELEQRIAARTRELRDANDALKHEIGQRRELDDTLRASERRIRTIIDSSFSAFVSIDMDGQIVDWNPSAERTFGWTQAEVAGRDLADVIIPERFREAHRSGLARMLAHGVARVLNQRLELPALTRSGAEITVEMTINSFAAADSVCFGAFLHDITERELGRRALAQKQQLLDAVLDSVDVGLVACAADGSISMFNRAARELHGLPPEALDPLDWAEHYDLFDADGTRRLEPGEVPLYRAWQGEIISSAALTVTPAGRPPRKLLASGRPMRGPGGELLGAVVALSDVTELAASRSLLEAGEQRLRAITDNVPAMIGQVDRAGNFVFLNSKAVAFFRKPASELLGHSVASAYDAAGYAKIAPHIALVMQGQRTGFEDEAVFGEKHLHYQASYIPHRAEDGSIDGFLAMAFDITDRKLSELRQRDSEERLRLITDNLPVLISYIDRDQRFRFANATHLHWLGIAPEYMIGKTALEVLGRDYEGPPELALAACLQGETVEGDMVLRGVGTERTVHSLFVPHRRGDDVIGAYILTTDVTSARLHEQQLKAMAMTDALTGLANRRSYDKHLASAIDRASRKREGIALMYLDVDRFKEINDSLGHALGDEVLRQFAQRLSAAVRKTDIVCRLAGDEFTIILEGIKTPAEAEVVGRKIVAAMAAPFALGERSWPVTASIGIAWNDGGLASAAALSHGADAALYHAKAAGRNTFRMAPP